MAAWLGEWMVAWMAFYLVEQLGQRWAVLMVGRLDLTLAVLMVEW